MSSGSVGVKLGWLQWHHKITWTAHKNHEERLGAPRGSSGETQTKVSSHSRSWSLPLFISSVKTGIVFCRVAFRAGAELPCLGEFRPVAKDFQLLLGLFP